MTTYMRRLLFSIFLLPLTSGAFTRVIDLPVDVSTSSEVETAIEFYQAESVQLDLYVKRNGVRLPLDSGLSVVWRAWVEGAPATLYINATGTVYNATAGHCRVTLTPAQANPTNQTYRYTVQLYDGSTYMGVGASGDLVVRYAPQSGSVAYVGTTSYFSDTLGALTPTAGRLIYGTGTAWATLAAGTTGQVLTAQGAASPIWSSAGAGDVTAVAVSGGLLTGGGTSGDLTIGLTTNTLNTAGMATDAEVAAAIAGTHAAATVTGGLLTLSGQQIGLSTSTVRSAVSGLYLTLAGTGDRSVVWSDDGVLFDLGDGSPSNFSVWRRGNGQVSLGVDTDVNETPYVWMESNDGFAFWTLRSPSTMWLADATTGTNLIKLRASLTAADLLAGTIPDARFPATLPAASGANLTALNATQITSGTVADARLNTAQRIETITSGPWVGPLESETAGWSVKSYTTNALPAIVEGLVNSTSTQVDGTLASTFVTPSDGTNWRPTVAMRVTLIGDSTTSGTLKYRLTVLKESVTSPIYDSGADQVLTSTSVPTVLSIPGSSLGTFAADTRYVIKLVISTKSSAGLYVVGTPKIEVLK